MRRGFTALEVILALAFFAVIALAVIGLFLSTRAADRASIVGAQAANLGAAEMRRIKARPYGTLVGYVTAAPAPYNVTSEGVEYHLVWSVSRLSDDPTDLDYGLLDLGLRLQWQQNRALEVGNNPAARQTQMQLILHSTVSPDSAR